MKQHDAQQAAAKKNGSRPSSERRSSERPSTGDRRESSGKPHKDCDCASCYNHRPGSSTPPRSSHGSKRVDANGDTIEEFDGDSKDLRLGLHGVPPSPPPDETQEGGRRRDGSHERPTRRPTRGNISTDEEGNQVETWDGDEAPRLRTHYDEDSLPNVRFPSPPPQYKRTDSARSSKGERPSNERRGSSRQQATY